MALWELSSGEWSMECVCLRNVIEDGLLLLPYTEGFMDAIPL